jgi:phage baseplate assembly protein W
MSKDFMGKGFKFPPKLDSKTGKLQTVQYEDDIKEAILIILSTSRGERAMRPDFGCGIHDYVFESANTAMLSLMEASVKEALVQWEPRIDLKGVSAQKDSADPSKIMIEIEYAVRATNNPYNLVYPFYLNEG